MSDLDPQDKIKQAMIDNDADTLKCLLDGWDSLERNICVELLAEACSVDNFEMLKLLLTYCSKTTKTDFLTEFVENNDHDMCERLLANGIETSYNDNYSQPPLISAVIHSDNRMVKLLLKSGANINIQDGKRNSALFYAIICRKESMCELLVSSGADVNLRNCDLKTPLHLVGEEDGDREKLAKVLVEAGCCINATDTHGQIPLILEYYNPFPDKFAQLLIQNGSYVDYVYTRGDFGFIDYVGFDLSSEAATFSTLCMALRAGLTLPPNEWNHADAKHNKHLIAIHEEYLENKWKLISLCRKAIRDHLVVIENGRAIVPRIKKLATPGELKSYLMLES